MGVLIPNASRNVTLVWPTLYLHDRVGECMIAIGYTTKDNQTGEIRQKVKFDTGVSPRSNVRPVLQGYYDRGEARKCPTVDLDTLDDCRPVNCHIKYHGKRNFFNRRHRRCQPVPVCIADTNKELPDVAYVPASNTCRDLENAVNEVEVRALSRGTAETAWRSEPRPYLSNIYCHHGKTDNSTGFCICHEGWTSKSVDNLEPSTELIHLCNVQMLPWPRLRANRLKIILTVIAALLGILVVLFCCATAYVMRRQSSSGENFDCGNRPVTTSCAPSSTRSEGSCFYDRPYKRLGRKTCSDTSCHTHSLVRH
ncbi:uncharacterized protein [Neodiprion pinetum]|uniref:uncharacterized protein isoform X1 n=1 Tax=Neodiprion pinetum TaxID=441929 RepID=UPI001EDEA8E1|nr:uncharacterized protein LOC124220523 isoform X1 [Neodiprion pinetum]